MPSHASVDTSFGNYSQHSYLLQSVLPPSRALKTKKTRTRTSIFENPKEVAAEFACAVTVPSSNQSDWVARNGNESLFRTLRRMIPEVGNFSTLSHVRDIVSHWGKNLLARFHSFQNLRLPGTHFRLLDRLANRRMDVIV